MKRIILSIAVLLVLGLAAGAIAYTRTNVAATASASCCCCKGEGDSCPMKKNAAGENASCCDENCCKDGKCAMKHGADGKAMDHESCPMKKKEGQAAHATMTTAEHEAMKAEGKSCCCSCCSDKNKQAA